ncbi:MAG: phospholipase A [Desulfobacterales bacterium]
MKKNLLAGILLFLSVSVTGAPASGSHPDGPRDSPIVDTETQAPYQTVDELFNLYQPYLENMAAYEPIYFLVGTDPEESKFQISLKYRFLNPKMRLSKKHPWLRGFHIAYTQTSFWDLESDSQPFDDTSYKPELFFLSPNLFSGKGLTHIFFQTGYQHESNGQGGERSRSTNFLYFKPIFVFFHQNTELGFQIAPKLWAYAGNDDDTNPDLYKYRGYFDLKFKCGKAESAVLESHLRWAEEGPSLRMDLTYPLDRLFDTRLQIYLQAQYVNMLAENLLNYQDRTRAVRLGISVVR